MRVVLAAGDEGGASVLTQRGRVEEFGPAQGDESVGTASGYTT